ncbi:hypothetical protein Ciccas_009907, partial [Cichlidogyrus casuarinus]
MAFIIPGESWDFSLSGQLINDSLANRTLSTQLSGIYHYLHIVADSTALFLSLANVINRAKINPFRRPGPPRPHHGNLEHQLVLFCLYTLFLACSQLAISLPLFVNFAPILNGNLSHFGHKLVSRLPGLMIVQVILRIASLWLILFALADRYSLLTRIVTSPLTNLFLNYSRGSSQDSSNCSSSSYSGASRNCCWRGARRLRSQLITCLCCIDHFRVGCCYDCRRRCSLFMRSRRLHYQNFDTFLHLARSLKPTILLGSVLSVFAMASSLPLLSCFRLFQTNEQWHLQNELGRTLFEYFWASVSLLLPTFLLTLCLLAILTKSASFRDKVNKNLHSASKEMQLLNMSTDPSSIDSAIDWVARDTWLITVLGFVVLAAW